jgi:hypothetical protein
VRCGVDNLNGVGEVGADREPDRRRTARAAADDLISVLVEAEMTDEDGETHRLSDAEIYSFTYLLLAAGSGTTWKQMGITLAALLARPELLDAVRQDPDLLRAAIEESVPVGPTDPMFSRFTRRDVELYGAQIPEGAVVHLCWAPPTVTPRAGTAPTSTTRCVRRQPHARVRRRRSTCALGHARRARRDGDRDRCTARATAEPPPRPRRRATEHHRHVRALAQPRSTSCSDSRQGATDMAEYVQPDISLIGDEHVKLYRET